MKKVKYIGTVSPWVDTLGGSGLTWTTGMEAVVSEDVGDELTGYPALFEAVAGFDGNGVTPEKVEQAGGAGGGGPTTLPVMQAAFDAGTAAEKATFQASVSGGLRLLKYRPFAATLSITATDPSAGMAIYPAYGTDGLHNYINRTNDAIFQDYRAGAVPVRIRISSYAQTVVLRVRSEAALVSARVVLDDGSGRRHSQTVSLATSAGTAVFVVLDTGAVGHKDVDFVVYGVSGVFDIRQAKLHPIALRPAQQRTIAFVTDSFGGPTAATALGADVFTQWVSDFLDCRVVQSTVGGSGYGINGSGTAFDGASRVSAIAAQQPTDIVFVSGVNDNETTITKASAVFSAHRAANPSVRMWALEPLPTTSGNTVTAENANRALLLRQQAEAAGVIHIPTTGISSGVVPPNWSSATTYNKGDRVTSKGAVWEYVSSNASSGTFTEPGVSLRMQLRSWIMYGTGNVGATTGDGPRDLLLESGGGVHPTAPWHVPAAQLIAQALI